MYYIMQYRVPSITIFGALLGVLLHSALKFGDLKWVYLGGTPVLCLLAALLIYYVAEVEKIKWLKTNTARITAFLFVLLLVAFTVHLVQFNNRAITYKDFKVKRTYVKGSEYTPEAMRFKKEFPMVTADAEMLYEGFGGAPGIPRAWTAESIRKNRVNLILTYCIAILALGLFLSWILWIAYEKKYAGSQDIIKAIMNETGLSNLEKYLLSFQDKKPDGKYSSVKLHIFLSYSSHQQQLAEKIYYALSNAGHMVFFDRNNLPGGKEYNTSIETAVRNSDTFLFLISPQAVAEGRYTLSELKFAAEQWPNASGFLLPVMVVDTPFDKIPPYAQSVTVLIPKGNTAVEIVTEVERIYKSKKNK